MASSTARVPHQRACSRWEEGQNVYEIAIENIGTAARWRQKIRVEFRDKSEVIDDHQDRADYRGKAIEYGVSCRDIEWLSPEPSRDQDREDGDQDRQVYDVLSQDVVGDERPLEEPNEKTGPDHRGE